MNTIQHLPEDIRSEFSINTDGQAFASRRAIARLTGITETAIRGLLQKIGAKLETHEIFESFTGQCFEGADLIPDTLVSLILEYYAYECQPRYRSEQAKRVCRVFRAIGFRVWIQHELNWQSPPQQTVNNPTPQSINTQTEQIKQAEEAQTALEEKNEIYCINYAEGTNEQGLEAYQKGGSVCDRTYFDSMESLESAIQSHALSIAHDFADKHSITVSLFSETYTLNMDVRKDNKIDLKSEILKALEGDKLYFLEVEKQTGIKKQNEIAKISGLIIALKDNWFGVRPSLSGITFDGLRKIKERFSADGINLSVAQILKVAQESGILEKP